MGLVFWDNAFCNLGYRRCLTIFWLLFPFTRCSYIDFWAKKPEGGGGWVLRFGSVIFLDRRRWPGGVEWNGMGERF